MVDLRSGKNDPDGTEAIHLLYGAVMFGIQLLERDLALLSLLVTTSDEPLTSPDQLRKLYKKWWRAFQVSSASSALKKIENLIPGDLHQAIGSFLPHRNWLAHRFFLEQFETRGDRAGLFARGTALRLVNLERDRINLSKSVRAHLEDVRASLPPSTGGIPPEMVEWAEDIAQLVFNRKVPPEVLRAIRP